MNSAALVIELTVDPSVQPIDATPAVQAGSFPMLRRLTSSTLVALLGAVAVLVFVAVPARAVPTASMPSSQAWPSVAVSIP